jgi:hypothetical protein
MLSSTCYIPNAWDLSLYAPHAEVLQNIFSNDCARPASDSLAWSCIIASACFLSYYADHQTEIQSYLDRNAVPDDLVHPMVLANVMPLDVSSIDA